MEGSRHDVMIVDDDVQIAKTVARVLRNHDVVTVGSARAALGLLATGHEFDVIICDMMMPGLTGRDFFELVTNHFPEYGSRIIFLTGGATTLETQEFLEKTTRPIVWKPYLGCELRKLVANIRTQVSPNWSHAED